MKKKLCIILVVAIVICAAAGALLHKVLPREPVSVSKYGIGSELDPVYLTAHRGGNTDAPENSLPAFESAREKNFYAAECDIIRTTDGRWLITHDDDVILHFFSFGKLSEKTYDEARKMKYSFDTNFIKYRDEKIPTLEEYLNVFTVGDTRPEIELKSPGTEGLEDVVKAIEERGLTEKAIVISFHYESLQKIHELNENIELWYLLHEISPEEVQKAKDLGCSSISAKYQNVTAAEIDLISSYGLDTALWTIDDPKVVKEFYDLGVRNFVTNRLGN